MRGLRARRALLWGGLWLLGAGAVFGAALPEFSTGYELPEVRHGGPRPGWLEAVDVAVLVALLLGASWAVLRRRSRAWIVALALVAVGYLGFVKAGCLCPVGSVGNVAGALTDRGLAVSWLATVLFVVPLGATLLFGRTFCGAACPIGALQDLVLVRPLRLPRWLSAALGLLPGVFLGLLVLLAANGSFRVVCRYDPMVPFFRLGHAGLRHLADLARAGSVGAVPAVNPYDPLLLAGVGVLLLAMFVARPYCRFVCPYGALLAGASRVSWRHLAVTPDHCVNCRLCEEMCPFDAILPPTARPRESRATGMRRLSKLLLASVAAMVLGGLLGRLSAGALARSHPTVRMAADVRRYRLAESAAGPGMGLAAPYRPDTVDAFDRKHARRFDAQPEVDPDAWLDAEAARIARRFRWGSVLFGLWCGGLVGARWLRHAVHRTRTGYEPDRGTCLACARCFEYCPREHLRLRQGGGGRLERLRHRLEQPDLARAARRCALLCAWIAAGFLLVVAVALAVRYRPLDAANLLDVQTLNQWRDELLATGSDAVRERILAADRALRADHFNRQEFARRGVLLALAGCMVLVAGLGIASWFGAHLPGPPRAVAGQKAAREAAWSRWATAVVAGVLALLALWWLFTVGSYGP